MARSVEWGDLPCLILLGSAHHPRDGGAPADLCTYYGVLSGDRIRPAKRNWWTKAPVRRPKMDILSCC
jgi:hypothetical protein